MSIQTETGGNKLMNECGQMELIGGWKKMIETKYGNVRGNVEVITSQAGTNESEREMTSNNRLNDSDSFHTVDTDDYFLPTDSEPRKLNKNRITMTNTNLDLNSRENTALTSKKIGETMTPDLTVTTVVLVIVLVLIAFALFFPPLAKLMFFPGRMVLRQVLNRSWMKAVFNAMGLTVKLGLPWMLAKALSNVVWWVVLTYVPATVVSYFYTG